MSEPLVQFEYPREEEDAGESAMELRLQGFRCAIFLLGRARTPRSQKILLEALLFVIARDNQPVAAIAKRLRVSRQHFSAAVSNVRKLTKLL